MSEPQPEFPLSPEELHRLEELARMPEPAAGIVGALAAAHVQWYRAWQAAGAPEQRAAEWTGIMIGTSFGKMP